MHQGFRRIAAVGVGMRMGDAVILHAVTVQPCRELLHQSAELILRHGRIVALVGDFILQFFISGIGSLLKSCLDIGGITVHEAVSSDPSGVEHGERCNRLDPLIDLCCSQGISAATADAEGCDPVGVDIGQRREKIHHAADVIDPVCGIVPLPRFSLTFTLIGGICCDSDISHLR